MQKPSSALALGYQIAAPSADDWVVTLFRAGGENRVLRVSPGTVARDIALAKAVRAVNWDIRTIVDVRIVRSSEHSRVLSEDYNAEFQRLSKLAGVQRAG